MTQQELFDLLYVQTQEIATKEGASEYAALSAKERRRISRTKGFFVSTNAKWWVDLFQDWAKGRIDEETIRGHILNYKTNRFYYPV
jgi:hypothetical protein